MNKNENQGQGPLGGNAESDQEQTVQGHDSQPNQHNREESSKQQQGNSGRTAKQQSGESACPQ